MEFLKNTPTKRPSPLIIWVYTHLQMGESVFRFSLVSVLNYVGHSIHSGHYLSDCYSRSGSCWLSYNDESVTMMTEERVVKKRQRSAYVLFYETK
ncbi:ubiquitin carboxyl-terminal hydrolase 37-like [Pygocentrus nattereri]|uniref:ubiquitin carboxyl-terminal hydrolase 37-like n=1 Tax=Pygocentrus nattereri TaxID=42514 RepID=UPI0018917FAD|nr:ubiquitin carboxyl-terminal hydrolase 37-like [Pygocentrus nattereri]